MATPKQIKAAKLLSENIGSKNPKTIEAILIEAGYTPEVARQQVGIMAGIRPLLDPFVEKLLEHRETVIQLMKEKAETAGYGDLVRSLDVTTKNAQLLSGKPTDSHKFILEEEEKKKIDDILNENED